MKNFILYALLSPILAMAQGTIPFTPAVIFNGDQARVLRSQIDINSAASLRTGTDDPTVVSVSAPQGSIYLQTGPSGGKVFVKQDAGDTTNWSELGSGGSVSSVALSMPAIFSVTGSPVISSGTLSASLTNENTNSVWSGPASGSNAPPTFRALVTNDIPNLDASKITSGKGSLSSSTTGVTIGSGSNSLFSSATVDIATASGSLTGLLTSTDWSTFNGKVSGSRNINTSSPLSGGGDLTSDRTISIPASSGSVDGYLSAVDWTTFNGKQASGNYITDLTGDVTASGPGSSASTVVKIQGFNVSASAPTDTQVLTYNSTSTQWEPQASYSNPSSGVAGSVQFSNGSSGFNSDATTFFWDNSAKKLGIGVATPAVGVHVVSSGSSGFDHGIIQENNSANAIGGFFSSRKSRGTFSSPTAISSGDVFGALQAQGYGTTTYGTNSAGAVVFRAAEAFSDTTRGTNITFTTTLIGSGTNHTAVLIGNDSGLTINNSAGTSGIKHITQSSTTAYSLSWPLAQGGAGQSLINDGSGILTWSSPWANQSLSNLTSPTAINQNLIFDKVSPAYVQTKDDLVSATQDLNLITGTAGSSASGNLNLTTGDTDLSQNAGNITLLAGNSGSPQVGLIQFKNGTEGSSGKLWTSIDTSGSGIWSTLAPSNIITVSGSTGSPNLITASGITVSTDTVLNTIFIAGDSGPVVVTGNPQISPGTTIGGSLVVIAEDSTNTVTLSDGNGLSLSTAWVGGLNSVLNLVWDGTLWVETSRR